MLLLTEDALLVCKHEVGKVDISPTQNFVTINQRRILVEKNPELRRISGCPLTFPFKPCLTTLEVTRGYSAFIRIAAHAVCLDTVTGLTDGTPPGTVQYIVRKPGQDFVGGSA
jgi:hypothetical protein